MKYLNKIGFKKLWPFYLDALISPMLFFMPAFLIVYFRDLGFDLFQISILMTITFLTTFLFEIPTGAIADLYGRKFSVILGAIIESLAFLMIFLSDEYYLLLFFFALLGIGTTFTSGAKDAWITDLVIKKKGKILENYFAISKSLDSLGLVISGLLGALLVKNLGTSIIWLVGSLSFLISIIFLSFAEEKRPKKNIKKSSFRELFDQSKKGIVFAKNNSTIVLILIFTSSIVFSEALNSDIPWITFLQSLNFPDYAFGYLWSMMGIAGILGPMVAMRVLKTNNERKLLFYISILMFFNVLLILLVNSIFFALVVLLISVFLLGMFWPIQKSYFQKQIKSRVRATVGSLESMVVALIAVISLPLTGLSVDFIGAEYTIFISALFIALSAIILLETKKSTLNKS